MERYFHYDYRIDSKKRKRTPPSSTSTRLSQSVSPKSASDSTVPLCLSLGNSQSARKSANHARVKSIKSFVNWFQKDPSLPSQSTMDSSQPLYENGFIPSERTHSKRKSSDTKGSYWQLSKRESDSISLTASPRMVPTLKYKTQSHSVPRRKYQRPSLEQIYGDRELLTALTHYMTKQYMSENILFLQATNSLIAKIDAFIMASEFQHVDATEVDMEILSIYDKFIRNDTMNDQINLSYACGAAIDSLFEFGNFEEVICQRFTLHQKRRIFDECILEIERLMQTSVLSPFYRSEEFARIMDRRSSHERPALLKAKSLSAADRRSYTIRVDHQRYNNKKNNNNCNINASDGHQSHHDAHDHSHNINGVGSLSGSIGTTGCSVSGGKWQHHNRDHRHHGVNGKLDQGRPYYGLKVHSKSSGSGLKRRRYDTINLRHDHGQMQLCGNRINGINGINGLNGSSSSLPRTQSLHKNSKPVQFVSLKPPFTSKGVNGIDLQSCASPRFVRSVLQHNHSIDFDAVRPILSQFEHYEALAVSEDDDDNDLIDVNDYSSNNPFDSAVNDYKQFDESPPSSKTQAFCNNLPMTMSAVSYTPKLSLKQSETPLAWMEEDDGRTDLETEEMKAIMIGDIGAQSSCPSVDQMVNALSTVSAPMEVPPTHHSHRMEALQLEQVHRGRHHHEDDEDDDEKELESDHDHGDSINIGAEQGVQSLQSHDHNQRLQSIVSVPAISSQRNSKPLPVSLRLNRPHSNGFQHQNVRIAQYLEQRKMPKQLAHVHFDKVTTSMTVSSAGTPRPRVCLLDSHGLRSGLHEWEIEVIQTDVMLQEVGVVGTPHIEHVRVQKHGIIATRNLGPRAVLGNELRSRSVYYTSINQDDTKRCHRDLKMWRGWRERDIIRVSLDLNKWRIKYYINGDKVGKPMSLQPRAVYFPVIAFTGHCQYRLRCT